MRDYPIQYIESAMPKTWQELLPTMFDPQTPIRVTEAAIAMEHRALKLRREVVELLERRLSSARDKLSETEQRLGALEEKLHRLRSEREGAS